MPHITPIEDQISAQVAEYCRLRGLRFTHINNEMWTSSFKQKNRSKRMGVSPGVPDYMVIILGNLVFLELKRDYKCKPTGNQKEWLAALGRCEGVFPYVVHGFDEARTVIDAHLDGKPPGKRRD